MRDINSVLSKSPGQIRPMPIEKSMAMLTPMNKVFSESMNSFFSPGDAPNEKAMLGPSNGAITARLFSSKLMAATMAERMTSKIKLSLSYASFSTWARISSRVLISAAFFLSFSLASCSACCSALSGLSAGVSVSTGLGRAVSSGIIKTW